MVAGKRTASPMTAAVSIDAMLLLVVVVASPQSSADEMVLVVVHGSVGSGRNRKLKGSANNDAEPRAAAVMVVVV
jgi:hypothetical protein